MFNKNVSEKAEFDASILMVMKYYVIYFQPYFGDFLRQETSPCVE